MLWNLGFTNMKQIIKHLILLSLFSLIYTGTYCQNIRVIKDDEGYYKGKHWNINIYVSNLTVDGKVVLPKYITITAYEWGEDLLFEACPDPGKELLFDIDGNQLIPYSYNGFSPHTIGKGHFMSVYKNSVYDSTRDLYTTKGKLVVPNYVPEILGEIKHTSDDKLGKVFMARAKVDNSRICTGVFDEKGNSILPAKYKNVEWKKDDDDNIVTFEVTNDNNYIGIMDRDKNWIVPLSKQFTKVTPSEISGKKYFLCMKKGYWGLYDAQFNEVIAPDYEGLEVLDETNFIKFRLNGFWGVMTLQTNTNTTKTIIPTTRGYTSIGRYIKSQKRFTYTMNGYSGECNHLGQQVSKIKVVTPKPSSSVASSSSSSSSSSRASSSSSSTSSTASSSSSSSKSNSGNNTTTIHVEHHHDPVPVQQWQACFACGGMGTMGCDNCGGSGTKYIGDRLHRCSRCNGRGIIPCNVCFGNKGQYITVYR